jgi:3-oxoacyl-[acyl-carrier-protein] synthase III
VVGLHNACSLIKGAGLNRVLLLAGDTQTKLCYAKDKNVVFLLGDAGTATLLEAKEVSEKIVIELMTDGSRFKSLYVPAGGFREPSTKYTKQIQEDSKGGKRAEDHLYMDGIEVFKFSATDVVKSIQQFMELEDLSVENIDYLVLHQANKFMTDKIARKLKFPPEKVPYSIKTYGNTSSASIPLTIVHNYNKIKCKEKIRCLLSGFGIGLSWGVADVVLDKIFCPEIIEINDHKKITVT